jgi:Cu/Ag efflux protein CusF
MTARRKTMRKYIIAAAAAVALASVNVPASAESELTDGQVTKVDQSAGKLTIKHGPMKSLGMDEGMTMVYRVKDPAMLGQVKAGDKIKFTAEHANGAYTVTKIQK